MALNFRDVFKHVLQLPMFVQGNDYVTTESGTLAQSSAKKLAKEQKVANPEDALLISASRGDGTYALLLDIDYPMEVLKSSNGNSHIYLDVKLSKHELDGVLEALREAGVIEMGFANSGIESEFGTTLRLPWVKKGEDLTLREQLDPEPPF